VKLNETKSGGGTMKGIKAPNSVSALLPGLNSLLFKTDEADKCEMKNGENISMLAVKESATSHQTLEGN